MERHRSRHRSRRHRSPPRTCQCEQGFLDVALKVRKASLPSELNSPITIAVGLGRPPVSMTVDPRTVVLGQVHCQVYLSPPRCKKRNCLLKLTEIHTVLADLSIDIILPIPTWNISPETYNLGPASPADVEHALRS